jgi:hypothetical protein
MALRSRYRAEPEIPPALPSGSARHGIAARDVARDAVPVEQQGPMGLVESSPDTDSHPKSHRWTLHRRGSAHDRDGLNVGVQSCKGFFGYRGAGDTRRKRITQRAQGAIVAVTRFVVLIRKCLGERGANSRGVPGDDALQSARDHARLALTTLALRSNCVRTTPFTLAPPATLVQRDTFR